MTSTPRHVSARGVRGLQVGRNNYQLNRYEYRVERCDVDFAAVLGRSDVRQALRALAVDPANPARQAQLDSALRRAPFFGPSSKFRVQDCSVTTSGAVGSEPDEAFETYLFVEDCEGVQVGDGGRQENCFLYLVAPTIPAAELLRGDADLRRALVDQICAPGTGPGQDGLHQRLSTALQDAVLGVTGSQTPGAVVDLGRHASVDIRNGDGVSVGIGVRQRNEVVADVDVSRTSLDDVREVASGVEAEARARLSEPMAAYAAAIAAALARARINALPHQALIDALVRAYPEIEELFPGIRRGRPADPAELEEFLLTARPLRGRAVEEIPVVLQKLSGAIKDAEERSGSDRTPPAPGFLSTALARLGAVAARIRAWAGPDVRARTASTAAGPERVPFAEVPTDAGPGHSAAARASWVRPAGTTPEEPGPVVPGSVRAGRVPTPAASAAPVAEPGPARTAPVDPAAVWSSTQRAATDPTAPTPGVRVRRPEPDSTTRPTGEGPAARNRGTGPRTGGTARVNRGRAVRAGRPSGRGTTPAVASPRDAGGAVSRALPTPSAALLRSGRLPATEPGTAEEPEAVLVALGEGPRVPAHLDRDAVEPASVERRAPRPMVIRRTGLAPLPSPGVPRSAPASVDPPTAAVPDPPAFGLGSM